MVTLKKLIEVPFAKSKMEFDILNKKFVYDLSHKFPNNSTIKNLRKLGDVEKYFWNLMSLTYSNGFIKTV